jgi:hypothetical protein
VWVCDSARFCHQRISPPGTMTLAQVRRHALSLPEVTEEPHFDFSSFRIRGKIFVTVPPDGEHIHIFLPEIERERALELAPDHLEELHWGRKVIGVRVSLPGADAKVVTALISQAFEFKSARTPKRNSPETAQPKARKRPKP